jgi:hypothetical protein
VNTKPWFLVPECPAIYEAQWVPFQGYFWVLTLMLNWIPCVNCDADWMQFVYQHHPTHKDHNLAQNPPVSAAITQTGLTRQQIYCSIFHCVTSASTQLKTARCRKVCVQSLPPLRCSHPSILRMQTATVRSNSLNKTVFTGVCRRDNLIRALGRLVWQTDNWTRHLDCEL